MILHQNIELFEDAVRDIPLNDNHETHTLHIAFVDSADKL